MTLLRFEKKNAKTLNCPHANTHLPQSKRGKHRVTQSLDVAKYTLCNSVLFLLCDLCGGKIIPPKNILMQHRHHRPRHILPIHRRRNNAARITRSFATGE